MVLLRNEERADAHQGQGRGFWGALGLWCLRATSRCPCCSFLAASHALDVSVFSPATLPVLEHGEAAPQQPLQTPGSHVSAPPRGVSSSAVSPAFLLLSMSG